MKKTFISLFLLAAAALPASQLKFEPAEALLAGDIPLNVPVLDFPQDKFGAENQRAHLEVEGHAAITGTLSNGVKYFINPSYSNMEEFCDVRRLYWQKSLECNLKVTGTKGFVSADFFDRHSYVLGPGFPSPNRMLVEGVPRLDGGLEDSLAGSFVAAIEGRRKRPETSLEESYAAVRVMNAAYDSIYQGCEITIADEK